MRKGLRAEASEGENLGGFWMRGKSYSLSVCGLGLARGEEAAVVALESVGKLALEAVEDGQSVYLDSFHPGFGMGFTYPVGNGSVSGRASAVVDAGSAISPFRNGHAIHLLPSVAADDFLAAFPATHPPLVFHDCSSPGCPLVTSADVR